MDFLSRKHALKFRALIQKDNTHEDDRERKALFYIIAGNEDLYSKVNHIYDFKEHGITPECLESKEVDFCTSSRKLITLAYNLYNYYPADVIDTFYLLDKNNYNLAIKAIDTRFGRNIGKEVNIENEIEEELEI